MYMFRFRYGIQKVFAEVSSTPPEPGHVGGDFSGCLLGLHTQTVDSLSALYRIPVSTFTSALGRRRYILSVHQQVSLLFHIITDRKGR